MKNSSFAFGSSSLSLTCCRRLQRTSHPIADGDTPEPEACDGIIAAIGRKLAAVRKVNFDRWGGRAHGDSGGHLARVAGTDGRRDLGFDRSLTPGHAERASAVARDRLSDRHDATDAATMSPTRRRPGEMTMRPFRAGRPGRLHHISNADKDFQQVVLVPSC